MVTLEELQAARKRLIDEMQRRPRAGAVWLTEGVGPDHELIERPAYLAPGTPYGLFLQQVLDLSEGEQSEVIEAWARSNFEPAPLDVQMNVGADPVFAIQERLDMEFHDNRTGGGGPAIQRAAVKLGDRVWFLRSPDPENLRREALERVQRLEDALRALPPPPPPPPPPPSISRLHNNPPEPLEDDLLSPSTVPSMLSVIAETREALQASLPDFLVLRAATSRLLAFATGLASRLASLGEKLAIKFMEGLAQSAGKAAWTALSPLAAIYVYEHGPAVVSKALHVVETLQQLLHLGAP